MLRAISYGGGVQSTALLVLAAQRKIDFPILLMANVGDDSEHPETLEYVRNIATPFAEDNGLELHLLQRETRDGNTQTLWERMAPDQEWPAEEGKLREPIPVYGMNGAPFRRSCTVDHKVKVTGKWLKEHGATKNDPATVAIGISVDEIQRANTKRAEDHERLVYPLLDLRLRRDDCMRVIADAGLPVPPKSSCFFCPFHRPSVWNEMARDTPELFEKSCQLEDRLNERRKYRGKPPVFLTGFGIPLREVANADQDSLPLVDSGCDSGWCMT